MIRAIENSGYFESLDAKAKERYREKLSCVGLSIQDDPYLPTNGARFVSDMATWPRIEFGHIFAYFITRWPALGKTVQNSITLEVNVKGFNSYCVQLQFSVSYGFL